MKKMNSMHSAPHIDIHTIHQYRNIVLAYTQLSASIFITLITKKAVESTTKEAKIKGMTTSISVRWGENKSSPLLLSMQRPTTSADRE
jgi:hypothetical protein